MVLEDFDDAPAYYKDAAGLEFFLAHVDGLKCAFDTGNFLYSEEDSLEVLPKFLGQIGHVHCKDRTFEVKKRVKHLKLLLKEERCIPLR